MPLCPWPTTHAAAFERPACGSAATAPGATPSAIAATSDNDVTGCRLLAGVADAVDRSGKVVRNQQRAVLHLRHVHRAAERDAGFLVEKAVGEYLGLVRRAVGLQRSEHDAVAD